MLIGMGSGREGVHFCRFRPESLIFRIIWNNVPYCNRVTNSGGALPGRAKFHVMGLLWRGVVGGCTLSVTVHTKGTA